MNTPWPGDVYLHPELLNESTADRINLQPFYDEIANGIYTNDADRVVFFESATYMYQTEFVDSNCH